jgi:hypothetical protein
MTDLQIPQGEHLENGRSLAGRPLKTLLIGTGIGALTGLAAALIMNRRAAKTGGEINLTAGDGIRMRT